MADTTSLIEEWRPVVGHEHRYAVSNCGRVKRIAKTRHGDIGSVLRLTTLDLSKRGGRTKYKRAALYQQGSSKCYRVLVHRLVAEAFIGDPSGFEINHKDGDGENNLVTNLEICTRHQNIRHSREILGRCTGERNCNAKLTNKVVKKIREMHANGWRGRAISDKLGINQSTVSNVVTGRSWKSV